MPPTPDLTRRPRARIAFADADMVRLRELYYDTAIPMVKVAQAFGVSASTLYHWIAEMDWPRRSASAPRIDARVDFFARVEAEPKDERSRRRRKGPPPDKYDLARDVAFAARAELDALSAERGRIGFEDRRRRAAVIDQLSRAIARMERVQAKRFAAFDELADSVAALARDARREKRATQRAHKPNYRLYGAEGKPPGGWRT